MGAGLLVGGCQTSADAGSSAAADTTVTNGDEHGDDHGEEGHHDEHGHGGAELALHMSRLQRWMHKTALSVQAGNKRLAEFYLHETEETVETIQTKAPTYEGYDIKKLSDESLAPSLASLDEAVEASDWPVARERLQQVATSCNECHDATDHGFVHIQLDSLVNPYAQSFAPGDDH
jgi:hypothetical protein